MPRAAKMVMLEILKYGYQPKIGLGPKADGIIELIQLKRHKGTTRLGYKLAYGGVCGERLGVTIFMQA
ncbi:hypothetical protein CQW23_10378 [Capsicum baccatum]|uniref:G-patch domain-containing protein n=1 Tax=Capsicum baccatum TaxID=33114 RepID=A0A2G2WZK8_CAPBA|nr:hypothetical protein CQW23_10378 [Capsicum baccatum]